MSAARTRYRVHRIDVKMSQDQSKLERFLNDLGGEVVAIIPNVSNLPMTWAPRVDFLLVVERVADQAGLG